MRLLFVAFAALAAAFAPLCLARAQSDPVTAADAESVGVTGSSGEARSAPAPAPSTAAAGSFSDLVAASPVWDAATAPIAESSPALTPPPKPAVSTFPYKAAGADSLVPSRPVIVTPSVPAIAPTGMDEDYTQSQGMEEIPQAVNNPANGSEPSASNDDLDSYQQQGADPFGASGIGSLRDFVSEGDESSPIGIQLREARRRLKSGGEADGLLVVNVVRNSPAAKAGLKPYHRIAQNMLTGAAIAGAMVFPPAILILPVLDYTQVGESYDMIIGVDGARVTNFIDFEERMRDVQPGQLVYLSIVRNGRRIQIEVPMPPNVQLPSY